MSPKFSEHLYDRTEKHCPKCRKNTIHCISVSWGENKYERNYICNTCGYKRSEAISKEECASVAPLVFEQISNPIS